MTKASAARLAGLHVLADDDARWRHAPVAVAEAACRAGAAVVQLRCKRATDREAIELGRRIRELTRRAGVLFVVNDRFDLALAVDADGVHLGQEDLPPASLPTDARARLLVGRSTHTPEQLEATRGEPVDYVALGPLFGTTSKESSFGPLGVDSVAPAAAAAAPRPLVAIGGIDAARTAAVTRAGADAVAVLSAVADAADPERAVRDLVRALGEARG